VAAHKSADSEGIDLMSLCGTLKPSGRGMTLKEMDEGIRAGAATGNAPPLDDDVLTLAADQVFLESSPTS
jgi:hypothetical protein